MIKRNKICPHCHVLVNLEEGHTNWVCPNCGGFIVEVYGAPQAVKKALEEHQKN